MKKILIKILCFVLFLFAGYDFCYADELLGWRDINGDRYYYDDLGNMLTGIQEIDGKKYLLGATSGKLYHGWTPCPDGYTYYADSEGVILTGIQEIDGNKYILGATSGRLYYGWTPCPDGNIYYSNNKGIIQYGWQTINNKRYYFDNEGKLANGFNEISGEKYYFKDGVYLTGIQEVDGKKYLLGATSGKLYHGWTPCPDGYTYYADSEGVILTGIQEIDGNKYILGATSGRLYYGWTPCPDGNIYYSNNKGIIQYGWQTINNKRYYFDYEGKLANGFNEISGEKYYFKDGVYLTGIQEIDGKKYLLGVTSGKLYHGWTPCPDGYTYYADSEGVILTGIQEIDGNKYILGATSGRLYYGLTECPDGNTYYSDKNGIIQYDWQQIGKNKYYFDSAGVMLKGVNEINGIKYLFDEVSGNLRYGLNQFLDGGVYYSDDKGIIQYGWQTVNKKVYYFNELGRALTGWQMIADDKYHFRTNGIMDTGFTIVDGKRYLLGVTSGKLYHGWTPCPDGYTYYADSEGVILTGIQEIDGNRYILGATSGRLYYGWTPCPDGNIYYSNDDGIIQTGDLMIDSNWYTFDELGRLKNGWQTINGETYYFYADGTRASGISKIAGVRYEFSRYGVLLHSNIKIVIDVSSHQGVINWDELWNSGEIDAVILRMGYGNSDEDVRFAEYISNVKRLGIPYSVYWFSYAKSAKDALDEANLTVSLYNKYQLNPAFKVYYDLEDWEYINKTVNSYDISKETYQEIANTYIQTLANYAISVGIYANTSFYNRRFNEDTRKYVEWIANWGVEKVPGNFRGWQFRSDGRVSGINGDVDFSIFYW